MSDEEIEYKLKFVKEDAALKETQAELAAVTEQTGVKQPEAAKKAEGAYSKFLKGAKEDVHLLHAPLKLLHGIMGIVSAAILAGTLAWELFRDKSKEVIKSTEENRDRHLDLVEAFKKAKDAGAQLTETQERLNKSSKESARLAGEVLIVQLERRNEKIGELIAKQAALNEKQEKYFKSYYPEAEAAKSVTDEMNRLKLKLAELNDEFEKNAEKIDHIKKGYKDTADSLEKATKAANARREALNIEKQAEIEHAQAVLQIKKESSSQILEEVFASGEQKRAALQDLAEQEKAEIRAEEAAKLAIINAAATREIGNAKIIDAQKLALKQQTSDKLLAVDKKSAADIQKVENEKLNKIKAALTAEMTAFSQAFAHRLGETRNLGEALKAAGASLIETIANQASAELVIQGVRATMNSFTHGSIAGGFAGGLAEAAATAAWYTALASTISGAGAIISGSIGGGGTSSADTGGFESSGGGSSGGGGRPAGGSGSGPLGLPSAGPGGPGTGQLNVQVILDGEVLLKFIQQASFNGRLQIAAQAVTG